MFDMVVLLATGTGLTTMGIGAVALLRPALSRWAGAEGRYALWLLVPVLLLAVSAAAVMPRQPVVWQVELPATDWAAPPAATPEAPRAAAAAGRGELHRLWAGVLALWAAGAGAIGLGLWGQHRRFARRALPAGASPALQGAWRPQVRLPADFRARFPAPERRLILLHERVHAERGDTRWTALALCLLVLQWFNPAAWWALRRLRQDMELAADAAVLRRRPHEVARYRQALLRSQSDWAMPMSVSPCTTHPLLERIAMLPHQVHRPGRLGLVTLLLAVVAGLAVAVQPVPAPAPVAPRVSVPELAPPATPVAAPEAPAAPVAIADQAAPGPVAAPAPVRTPAEPPVSSGYSKLRMDVAVTVNGQRLPPMLLLQTFNEVRPYPFTAEDGAGVRLLASGRPYTGDAVKGQDLILLEFVMLDAKTGALLAKPRIVTKDGTMAMIERGEEGGEMLRIEVLPRFVQTRLHDTTGALAELKREIEAGQAPALHFKP
jgi:beta-lactamase regulating signal transducer with metallopeptidase domain